MSPNPIPAPKAWNSKFIEPRTSRTGWLSSLKAVPHPYPAAPEAIQPEVPVDVGPYSEDDQYNPPGKFGKAPASSGIMNPGFTKLPMLSSKYMQPTSEILGSLQST
jgi:hypothetical protein